MGLTDLYNLLKNITGFSTKVAYRAWPVGSAPALPFICYYVEGSDNAKADNSILLVRQNVVVELYTQTKDVTTEAAVEAALNAGGIIWEKTETFIETENCYQIAYDFII